MMVHITRGTFGLEIGLWNQWPRKADIALNMVQIHIESEK